MFVGCQKNHHPIDSSSVSVSAFPPPATALQSSGNIQSLGTEELLHYIIEQPRSSLLCSFLEFMIFPFYFSQTTNALPLPSSSMTLVPFVPSNAFFFGFFLCACMVCIGASDACTQRWKESPAPRAPSTFTFRVLVFVLRFACDWLLPAPTVVCVEGGDRTGDRLYKSRQVSRIDIKSNTITAQDSRRSQTLQDPLNPKIQSRSFHSILSRCCLRIPVRDHHQQK